MFDFVIQEHSRDGDTHWDLMLRCGEKLLTWQIGVSPDKWGAEPMECAKIFDHRLIYLTYEGPISNGRGAVKIADHGQYIDPQGNLLSCLPFDKLNIILNGNLLCGDLSLARVTDDNWTLSFLSRYPANK